MPEREVAAATVERLSWDSAFFGFPIARIRGVGEHGEGIDSAINECRSAGVTCAYLLCGAGETSAVEAAVRRGFRLVDVRVTLRADLAPTADDPPGVRAADARDLDALRAIARGTFRDSRFFTDGRFPEAKADSLFERWVERDVESGVAVVIEREGRIAGFATGRFEETEAAVGLVGVAETSRGRGVGSTATRALLSRFAARVRTARVVTQGRNTAALALYERHGFRTSSIELWLHWWADENPV